MPTDMDSSPSKRLLTAQEVADRLAVDAQTVRSWCRKAAMKSWRVGPYHALRIDEAELQRHLRGADPDA